MRPGDRFTIEGCGRGAKGQTVVNGFNVATGRRCRAVTLTVFVHVAGRAAKKKRILTSIA